MTYIEFIKSCRNKPLPNDFEVHHIEPRSIGGVDIAENRIALSKSDHYIAHKLLAIEHPYNLKLWQAWWQVFITHPECQSTDDRDLILEQLEKLPFAHSEESRRNRSAATRKYMKSLTPEQRKARADKISKSNTQTYKNVEVRNRVSLGLQSKWQDAEYRNKLSNIRRGKRWFTDGVHNTFAYSCPPGYYKGMTRKTQSNV